MKKIISLLLMSIMLLSFPLVIAHGESEIGYDGHHESMMGGFGNFMWVFGWLFMILIIIALILFIVWLVKELTKTKNKRRKRR